MSSFAGRTDNTWNGNAMEGNKSQSQNKGGGNFGMGFYTTTNKQQAISFCEIVYRRQKSGSKVVNVYEFDEGLLDRFLTLKFDSPDEAWLDFVSDHRNGVYSGMVYDLIYGPVADDDVYQTLLLYMSGALGKEQALQALKIKELYNQLVFSTQEAMNTLKFISIRFSKGGNDMNNDKFTAMLILLVPAVVELIVKEYKLSEIKATEQFYNSKVYDLLEDENTKLWHFSPLTLFNMFDEEQKTGRITFPEEV